MMRRYVVAMYCCYWILLTVASYQALTTADVGVAVGSGSEFYTQSWITRTETHVSTTGDVAISSASFILIKSDLRSILTLADLSRKVFNRVKFNFVSTQNQNTCMRTYSHRIQAWALCYNMAALPIAAGVLYPLDGIRLDPVWASLAMALS